jgi:predicted Zn finger-like uncharacterized protein
MRIVCPNCAATYEVPMALLKPGQTVRCARCAREWTPPFDAPPPMAGEPPMSDTRPEPLSAPEEPREPFARPIHPPPLPPKPVARSGGVALRLAWVASLVVLGVLVWGGYAQRTAIMQAWPPSIRVYAALGLTGDH